MYSSKQTFSYTPNYQYYTLYTLSQKKTVILQEATN